jgi:hypothetical protein
MRIMAAASIHVPSFVIQSIFVDFWGLRAGVGAAEYYERESKRAYALLSSVQAR